MRQIRVSPSDFGFLYRDCPRCTWLKLRQGIKLPERPMPGVFSKIDSAMKQMIAAPGFLEGVGFEGYEVAPIGDKIESAPVRFEEFGVELVISGKPDRMIWNPGTGEVAIFENKTSEPSMENLLLYGNQQAAYAYALMNPAEGASWNVTEVALCTFDPTAFSRGGSLSADALWASMQGAISIHRGAPEIERLKQLLWGVAYLVSQDKPPTPPTKAKRGGGYRVSCSSCNFFLSLHTLDHVTLTRLLEALPLVTGETEAAPEPSPVITPVGDGGLPKVSRRHKQ